MLHKDIVKLSTTTSPSDATLENPTDSEAKLLFSQCKDNPLSESATQRHGCNASSDKLPIFGHLYLGPGSMYSPLTKIAKAITIKVQCHAMSCRNLYYTENAFFQYLHLNFIPSNTFCIYRSISVMLKLRGNMEVGGYPIFFQNILASPFKFTFFYGLL